MGPLVGDASLKTFELRPFQSSTTYRNLKRERFGVFHITDDVNLLARAAVSDVSANVELIERTGVAGRILAGACRWYAFQVSTLDDREERTSITCEVTQTERLRDFLGFNRAKHAVLEAAILATRIHILPREEILEEFKRLDLIVRKTAGTAELDAFAFLCDYVDFSR